MTEVGARGWTENRAATRRLAGVDVRELVAHRELALFLASKDLRLRYKQTVLGVGWAVLQPLVAAAIFSVVFGRLTRIPSDGIPYPLFVFAGFALWSYLSSAVAAAAQSLAGNAALVTKVYFPRLLAPIASLLPGLVDLVVALALVGALMAYYGVTPGPRLALAPLWVAAALVVALGAGAWLAALTVRYRDVRHALPFALQSWLFASPIVYPTSLVPEAWRYVYALNPVAGVVDGFRWSLVGGPSPGLHDVVSLGSGLVLLTVGVLYFRAAERAFADVI